MSDAQVTGAPTPEAGLAEVRGDSAATPQSGAGEAKRLAGRRDVAAILSRYGVLVAWAVVIGIFSILRPHTFPTLANFQTIFGSQAVLLILTLGLIISLTAGEFDLSIAAAMSVSLVLVGYLNVLHHWAIGPTVIVALLSGVLIGAINAFFVIVVGVQSIVVTLGSGTLFVGIGVAINGTTTAGVSQTLVNVTSNQVFGLPLAFYYALGLTVAVWYCLRFTPLGRYLYFVGANANVARLSGLPVDLLRGGALIATSLVGAIAGVIFAGTLGSADPNISSPLLLPAFAAAFLGSTAVTPGRFNAWGTFVAVYFLITGITGLELLGLSGWIEDVFYGGSLVTAVALSRVAAKYQLLRRVRAAAGAK